MSKPVLLTVDDDPGVSRAVARDLRRRYGEGHRVVRAKPGGGSRIHVTWSRRGKTVAAKAMTGLIALTRGLPVKASMRAGLRQIESPDGTR